MALDRRDHAEAVRWLSETLELHPEATIAHYPLALAFRGLGDVEKAQEHVEQRAEVDLFPHDPRMDRVRTTLKNPLTRTIDGMRAYAAGRWHEAVEEFRAAVELDPEDPLLRSNLAVGLYRLEDLEGASSQFDEALRLRPDHAPALYGAGALLERRGDD